MHPVWIVAHLLAMEGALAAAGLCLAWRRDRGSARLLASASCVPVFHLIGVGTLGWLWPLLLPPFKVVIAVMALLICALWAAVIRRAGSCRRHARSSPGLFMEQVWIPLAAAIQLAATLLSAMLLGRWFQVVGGNPPIPDGWLAVSICLGACTAANLIGSAVRGIAAGHAVNGGEPASVPAVPQSRKAKLVAATRRLELALALRILSIAVSLQIGAAFHPFGARYFFMRTMVADSSLMLLRLMLGLALPTFFGALVLLDLRDGKTEPAARHFIPLLILILISEVLAAGLTVGMLGIAL